MNTLKALQNGQELKIYTVEDETVVESTPEIDDILHQIAIDRADKKRAADHEKRMTEQLKMFVGDATRILDSQGDVDATWNEGESNSFDTISFKAKFPKVYEEFLRKGTKRTLLIKKVW